MGVDLGDERADPARGHLEPQADGLVSGLDERDLLRRADARHLHVHVLPRLRHELDEPLYRLEQVVLDTEHDVADSQPRDVSRLARLHRPHDRADPVRVVAQRHPQTGCSLGQLHRPRANIHRPLGGWAHL